MHVRRGEQQLTLAPVPLSLAPLARSQVDSLIVCGGMAFTFKKTLDNVSIGTSLFDEAGAQKVASLVEKAKAKGVELVFPVDYVTADKFDKDAETSTATDEQGIPEGWMGLDAGVESRKLFADAIKKAKTILWNGPAGVFEFEKFAGGSKATLDACIEAKEAGATVIVGGGASPRSLTSSSFLRRARGRSALLLVG